MKIFYEVFNGGTDGRDCRSIGYFETRALAEAAAKGQGAMGYGDGDIYECQMTTEEDVKNELKKKEIRKKALKKLTKEEKEALDLDKLV